MNAAPGVALWPRRDRIAVAGLQAVGLALMALSWIGVSGTTRFSRQIAWVNVGGAGLTAVMFGCALWVHRGRRQVGLHLHLDLTPRLRRPAPAAGPEAVLAAVSDFVSGPGMARYHRPDCQAVTGKSVSSASPEAHRAAGRQACGLCFWGTPPDPRGQP